MTIVDSKVPRAAVPTKWLILKYPVEKRWPGKRSICWKMSPGTFFHSILCVCMNSIEVFVQYIRLHQKYEHSPRYAHTDTQWHTKTNTHSNTRHFIPFYFVEQTICFRSILCSIYSIALFSWPMLHIIISSNFNNLNADDVNCFHFPLSVFLLTIFTYLNTIECFEIYSKHFLMSFFA